MIFITAGEEWRNIRNCLTPTFTTGKIKKVRVPSLDIDTDTDVDIDTSLTLAMIRWRQ